MPALSLSLSPRLYVRPSERASEFHNGPSSPSSPGRLFVSGVVVEPRDRFGRLYSASKSESKGAWVPPPPPLLPLLSAFRPGSPAFSVSERCLDERSTTSFPITDKEPIRRGVFGQVYRIAMYRECCCVRSSIRSHTREPTAAIRNGTGGPVSLLRGERGQKERDERTCARARIKSQADFADGLIMFVPAS